MVSHCGPTELPHSYTHWVGSSLSGVERVGLIRLAKNAGWAGEGRGLHGWLGSDLWRYLSAAPSYHDGQGADNTAKIPEKPHANLAL